MDSLHYNYSYEEMVRDAIDAAYLLENPNHKESYDKAIGAVERLEKALPTVDEKTSIELKSIIKHCRNRILLKEQQSCKKN